MCRSLTTAAEGHHRICQILQQPSEIRILGTKKAAGRSAMRAETNTSIRPWPDEHRRHERLRCEKVIATCPHGYNALKRTTLTSEAISKSIITPRFLPTSFQGKITLKNPVNGPCVSDSCFLGRYNSLDEPERCEAVPAEMAEMERNLAKLLLRCVLPDVMEEDIESASMI